MHKGTVVQSKAGRDRGCFLAVLATEGDFALVADGRERPLGRPKKKRLKHLAVTNMHIELSGITSDKQLRAALLASGAGLRAGEGGNGSVQTGRDRN